MLPTNVSVPPSSACTTYCFLHALPTLSSSALTFRTSLSSPQRRVRSRPTPVQSPVPSTPFLCSSASSDETPQTDVAPTTASPRSSLDHSNNWQSSSFELNNHNSSSPSNCTSTSSSLQTPSIPLVTSVTLKFNGSDPLPSVASLMRYMNDLRPKLDYLDPRSRERVLSALEVANVAHSGQMRKSGEPFIIHPIAVAAILADLRMDRDCIIAGLLHDTVEDTPVTLEDLETLFGTDVRRIVEGETKLTKLAKKMHATAPQQAQNLCQHQQRRPSSSNPGANHSEWPNENGVCVPSENSTYYSGASDSSPSSFSSFSPISPFQNERDKREEELQKQADNLRAMFIAMTEDVRVIIVKLADRLHNMRTLAHMNVTKQKKISKETLEFFAPLAHRLGMRRIKSELEELSFRYLHPEDYQHLKYEVETMLTRSKFEHYLKSAEATITEVLQQDRILYNMIRSVEVVGSTKELYSIYRRIQAGENVSAMLDIATMRVVVDLDPGVDSNQACYHVLGRIHTMWKPLPKRLKDYIAFPKPNGYQSLHTTVLLGPKFNFLTMEIQIRTAEMHRIAEEGIAAELFLAGSTASASNASATSFSPTATKHSEHHIGDGATNVKEDELSNEWRRRTTSWLLNIREYIKEFSSSKDLVDAVRKDLLGNRVFVFTPKGNIVDLPKDSTPIDVAYRIHSDVGNTMIGAKVNGKLVSLDYKLQNADVVKIISSQFSKGPSSEWITFAKSRTARQKIRQFLRARDRDNMLDRGRRLLEDEARAILEPVPEEKSLLEIIPRLCAVVFSIDRSIQTLSSRQMSTVDDLYVEIARRVETKDEIPLERTVLRLLRDRRHKSISQTIAEHRRSMVNTSSKLQSDAYPTLSDDSMIYTRRHENASDGEHCEHFRPNVTPTNHHRVHVEAMLAPCCHPIKGDEVCGVWIRGEESEILMVHRRECRMVDMNTCGNAMGTTDSRARNQHDVIDVKWAVRQREVDDGIENGGLSVLHFGQRRRQLLNAKNIDREGRKEAEDCELEDEGVDSSECTVEDGSHGHKDRSLEENDGEGRQPARLVVVARDCTGLLAYVTGVMAGMGTSIQRCSTLTDRDGMTATLAFEVLVRDAFHLRRIVERVEGCEEVESARRIGANESDRFFRSDALAMLSEPACWCNGEANVCVECEQRVWDEMLRNGQRVDIRNLEVDRTFGDEDEYE